ncbi:acyl-CoA N-acyltransferase [Trametes maxima]|nr:acyl-CoA N-acyltransferase [Trametes maxima]
MSVFYDLVTVEEVEDANKIEVQVFPPDEAESLEAFRNRHHQAPELFLGAYVPVPESQARKLVGFICATLSPETILKLESMSQHVPGASSICIHSVCVDPEHRQKHIGLNLLRVFVARAERRATTEGASYERVLLITHEELRGFYERAGFEWLGRSAVVYGSRPWYTMRKEFVRPGE